MPLANDHGVLQRQLIYRKSFALLYRPKPVLLVQSPSSKIGVVHREVDCLDRIVAGEGNERVHQSLTISAAHSPFGKADTEPDSFAIRVQMAVPDRSVVLIQKKLRAEVFRDHIKRPASEVAKGIRRPAK